MRACDVMDRKTTAVETTFAGAWRILPIYCGAVRENWRTVVGALAVVLWSHCGRSVRCDCAKSNAKLWPPVAGIYIEIFARARSLEHSLAKNESPREWRAKQRERIRESKIS